MISKLNPLDIFIQKKNIHTQIIFKNFKSALFSEYDDEYDDYEFKKLYQLNCDQKIYQYLAPEIKHSIVNIL